MSPLLYPSATQLESGLCFLLQQLVAHDKERMAFATGLFALCAPVVNIASPRFAHLKISRLL